MKFFKPEDFYPYSNCPADANSFGVMAAIANGKLEREGKVVYFTKMDGYADKLSFKVWPYNIYRAFLINIEPNLKCTHTKEKVRPTMVGHDFVCECGVKVQPSGFEELK